ncbi:MAG: winged helix-turn-helix transcriptional regulator [Candidatus Woesearchaeota archaeon]|nr:winged helix-turn-helix transcriptional regulator [Candidatus Woesearchaeota archaeon]
MVEFSKIKLDKTDRKILFELDKNCRIPASTLAKKVHKSRQTVEYRINQLMKNGIITGFQTSFNPHKIGYKLYKIYLRLRNIPEERQELITYLHRAGNVYWMGECSGIWDLVAGIFAKNDYELFEFKNELISKFTNVIIKEAEGTYIDVLQYPKMYFTNELCTHTLFAGEIVHNKLDDLDYAILGEIVNQARMPITELARRTKTTPAIVRRRLKQLEEKGVILQYRVGIDLNKLGLELYKAIIKVDRYTKDDDRKMREYLARLPNVHYFIRHMWQLEPEIVADNYQEYYEIIENLKKAFPHVIRTVDSVLMITDEWTPGFKNLLKA